jgi:hypothetical protein
MTSRRKRVEYHDGAEAARRFEHTMDRLLRVSKEELAKREAQYQESIKDRPRRGRKSAKH